MTNRDGHPTARALAAELERAVERARELSSELADSEEEMSHAEWCFAVLERLLRLPVDDLAMLDQLCLALSEPTPARTKETATEVTCRLVDVLGEAG